MRDLSSDLGSRRKIISELLPNASNDIFITPPFFCDYGWNLHIGKKFYCNTGCIILDGAPVTIGDNVMFGPNVQLYTPIHAFNPEERANLVQWTKPIHIGNKVWIGGGAIVCANVTIGEGSVIGAGSVVCKDIPAGVLAVGNPCRVVKRLADKYDEESAIANTDFLATAEEDSKSLRVEGQVVFADLTVRKTRDSKPVNLKAELDFTDISTAQILIWATRSRIIDLQRALRKCDQAYLEDLATRGPIRRKASAAGDDFTDSNKQQRAILNEAARMTPEKRAQLLQQLEQINNS